LTAWRGARDDRTVGPLRATLCIALAPCAGCRTPPYDLEDAPAPRDLSTIDQAAIDQAREVDLLAPDDCPPEAKLIYLVDAEDNRLSSFRPDTLAFTDIAVLSCGTPPGYFPDSMAVQRDGHAWVEWADANLGNAVLHQVDIRTGACDATPQGLPPGSPSSFGMAFTIDNGLDSLYLMGPLQPMDPTVVLGQLDLAGFRWSARGTLDADGDLSGSSDGHIYAFLPNWTGLGTRVIDLDKATAAPLKTWSLPSLDRDDGDVAIAAWGGKLWLFVGRGAMNGTTAVFSLDPSTGGVTTAIADTGRHVVGAGVAPCK
jgi:hypothetical protein